jgi:SAM-dependent methyltransferase
LRDSSNGYERVALEFLAGRGSGSVGIGEATVRKWAQTLPRGATVLELGCGAGVPITRVLVEAGLNVWALDAAPTLVAAFRQRFPDVPVACEPVEESAFFHRSFDAVLAWGLLFLLPAAIQLDILRRVAAVLEPGGRLLFTSPPQAITWTDAMTGLESRSLGAEAYRECLATLGAVELREYEDEGQNHYYDVILRPATRPVGRTEQPGRSVTRLSGGRGRLRSSTAARSWHLHNWTGTASGSPLMWWDFWWDRPGAKRRKSKWPGAESNCRHADFQFYSAARPEP